MFLPSQNELAFPTVVSASLQLGASILRWSGSILQSRAPGVTAGRALSLPVRHGTRVYPVSPPGHTGRVSRQQPLPLVAACHRCGDNDHFHSRHKHVRAALEADGIHGPGQSYGTVRAPPRRPWTQAVRGGRQKPQPLGTGQPPGSLPTQTLHDASTSAGTGTTVQHAGSEIYHLLHYLHSPLIPG